ncbi:MAG: thermonuclease family protein [Actinomycetota bacterium]|nr:thermonuclease family protein [Actinomycetota bacterium]
MLRRLILVVCALGLAGCLPEGGGDGASGAPEAGTGRVVRVVDGDTIHVELTGRREKVRYIGVDTPETRKPGSPIECFGKRASAHNARLVAGERVRLLRDAEPRDRYGRLLAYVYRVRDGLFVNAELVRGGYAQPLTIPPNVAHAAEFSALAREAREAGRGLWAAC